MDAELAAAITQFGTAGLIGWLWITERRSAAERDQQLRAVHEKLVQERAGFEVVVKALTNNTRALAGVEAAQRELAQAVRELRGPGGLSNEAPARAHHHNETPSTECRSDAA